MTTDIESNLKEILSYKLVNKKNYAALLNDYDIRDNLESIFVQYDISDLDQIYALSFDSDLTYLLEAYYFDRNTKPNEEKRLKENSLRKYYHEISKYPLLSKEEEVELFTKYKSCSDPEEKDRIKDKIVTSNLRLVASIAKAYVNRGFDLLELIAEGNIGLIMCVDRFDVNLGYKFSTYAEWWIRQAITKALADKSKIIRVPAHLFQNFMKVNGYLDQYYESHGEDMPLTEENLNQMAQDLGFTMYTIHAAIRYKEVMSLDQPITLESDVKSFSDFIPSFDESPEDVALYKKQIEEIDDIMVKHLTDNEKCVLYYRYGFCDGEPKTYSEIGEILGFSAEYIRQLDNKSIQKIRSKLNMQDLKYKIRKKGYVK